MAAVQHQVTARSKRAFAHGPTRVKLTRLTGLLGVALHQATVPGLPGITLRVQVGHESFLQRFGDLLI